MSALKLFRGASAAGVFSQPVLIGLLVLLALAAVAVAYHVVTVSALEQRLVTADATADAWRTSARHLDEQLRIEREDRAKALAAERKLTAAIDDINARYDDSLRRIRGSAPGDDGPVAPVLRDAIEALP